MNWAPPLVVIAAIWLGGCSGVDREAARSSISDETVFRISEHNSGYRARGAAVGKDDPRFEELMLYFQDPASTAGDGSLVTYAPGLMVECETIQMNFIGESVVVATRASARENWNQRTRAMTADDERIRAILTEWLDNSSH